MTTGMKESITQLALIVYKVINSLTSDLYKNIEIHELSYEFQKN